MRISVRACLLAAAIPAWSASAAADTSASIFGVRESVEGISLSPLGDKLAYLVPVKGQGSALYVVDLPGGAPHVVFTTRGDPDRIANCRWSSEQRLICTIYGMVKAGRITEQPLTVNRLIAIDADGKNLQMLSQRENQYQTRASLYGGDVLDWLPAEQDKILMIREYIPEQRGKSRIGETSDGVGVVRLDTRSLSATRVEPPRNNAAEYISDGHGIVRIMGMVQTAGATGQFSGKETYLYRTAASRDWKPFSVVDVVARTGLNPYRVDPKADVAYAMDKVDGRQVLFRVPLDGSGRREVAYADPRYDVDDVVTLGRGRRVIGASFVSDRREIVYFDEKLKALSASLSKALPDLPLVNFVDESDDGSKMLIFAGSDTDPGRYYLFDTATHRLEELMPSRPQLEGTALAKVQPIQFPAADGTMIPAYLTLPPGSSGKGLPAIVLPHGGPSARDEWGFDWLSQYFAHRGYAVLQPNFRGSTGYGDAFFQKNGFLSWRTAIGDVADAGRWLTAQGIAAPGKLAIFGWSYGGYAALQSNVLAPDLFKAAVAVAPVTDLPELVEEERDFTDFAITRAMIGSGAQLHEGSPAENAAAFKAPVLIFHGTMDRNVQYHQSEMMDAALARAGKEHQLVTYPGLDHYLNDSAARQDMLAKSDAFLRKALGLP